MGLQSAIARWVWHMRIRRKLRRRSKVSSSLIDDICPAEQQAAEAVGSFWHV